MSSRVRFEECSALADRARELQHTFHETFSDLRRETKLPELIRELGKLKNLIEVTTSRALAEVHKREETIAPRFGAKNSRELYTVLTGEGHAEAKRKEKLAVLEDSHLSVRARRAYQQGRIHGTVFQLICDGLEKLPESERVHTENKWLEIADPADGVKPSLGGLRKVISTTVAEHTTKLDPERMMRSRGITLNAQENGLVRISGTLIPEVAATLGRGLDVINTPVNTKLQTVENDQRSPQQKNHDALAIILNAALSSKDLPEPAGKPAIVLIHTTEERLHNPQGASVISGFDGVPTLIPSAEARTAGCAGGIQKLVLDHEGRIVKLNHEQRAFNANQRRALVARDGGCVIPGCAVPPGWCEAHHIATWASTKRTNVSTGALLCWHHHRSVDSGGWEVRARDGLIEVRRPFGGPWQPGAQGVRLTTRRGLP